MRVWGWSRVRQLPAVDLLRRRLDADKVVMSAQERCQDGDDVRTAFYFPYRLDDALVILTASISNLCGLVVFD